MTYIIPSLPVGYSSRSVHAGLHIYKSLSTRTRTDSFSPIILLAQLYNSYWYIAQLAEITRSSSADEIANVNFLC